MSEMLIEFLKTLDIGQLISLILISWFFYSRLNNKIDKLDQSIMKINEKSNDIDKRLFAVETMLHMKDCCMLKEERHHKKAS